MQAPDIYEPIDKCGVNKKITNFQSKALALSHPTETFNINFFSEFLGYRQK